MSGHSVFPSERTEVQREVTFPSPPWWLDSSPNVGPGPSMNLVTLVFLSMEQMWGESRVGLSWVIWFQTWCGVCRPFKIPPHMALIPEPLGGGSDSKDTWFSPCYRLNVCFYHKTICWNLIPSLMVLGGGAFWEVIRSIWNGISAPESSLVLSTTGVLQKKDMCLWTRKQVLTRRQICSYYDLRLFSFQNCKKQMSAVYKPAVDSIL